MHTDRWERTIYVFDPKTIHDFQSYILFLGRASRYTVDINEFDKCTLINPHKPADKLTRIILKINYYFFDKR